MPGMINDPEAIQKFRYQLVDLVDALRKQLKRTDEAMETVASSWKDAQFNKYRDEFAKDRDAFEPLCRDIDEFEAGPLAELQSILEQYNDL